jgi:uncharacterized membrane protein YbhN (UPF0104 family)
MTTRTRQLAKLLIRILITVGLLIFVFHQIEFQQFWQTIKTARWEFLIAVWALTVILFWINSIKMRFILKKQGCHVHVGTIFGASSVTRLYAMVIPEILSTGVKWHILRKNTGKGSNVFSSMVYNQLSLFVVMIIIGLIALIVTDPISLLLTGGKNKWLLPSVCGVLLAAIILISLLLLNNRTGSKITKAIGLLLKPLPERIHQKAQEILEQIAIFQSAGAKFHLTVTAITIISALITGAFIYTFAARAANITTTPVAVFMWLYAIIYVLNRLPISVANLGVREVTLVSLLGVYGVEKSAALLMSMILFSGLVLMAIIGVGYQLFWMLKTKGQLETQNNGFIEEKP